MITTRADLELIQRHQTAFDFGEQGFGDLVLKLDLLHDAASVGRAGALTDLSIEALPRLAARDHLRCPGDAGRAGKHSRPADLVKRPARITRLAGVIRAGHGNPCRCWLTAGHGVQLV